MNVRTKVKTGKWRLSILWLCRHEHGHGIYESVEIISSLMRWSWWVVERSNVRNNFNLIDSGANVLFMSGRAYRFYGVKLFLQRYWVEFLIAMSIKLRWANLIFSTSSSMPCTSRYHSYFLFNNNAAFFCAFHRFIDLFRQPATFNIFFSIFTF